MLEQNETKKKQGISLAKMIGWYLVLVVLIMAFVWAWQNHQESGVAVVLALMISVFIFRDYVEYYKTHCWECGRRKGSEEGMLCFGNFLCTNKCHIEPENKAVG